MMKYPLYLLAALALCACAGPEGNPNGQPYADQPGGAMAVRPEPTPTPSYNPYAQSPNNGMQLAPPPAMPLSPPPRAR